MTVSNLNNSAGSLLGEISNGRGANIRKWLSQKPATSEMPVCLFKIQNTEVALPFSVQFDSLEEETLMQVSVPTWLTARLELPTQARVPQHDSDGVVVYELSMSREGLKDLLMIVCDEYEK